MLLFTKKIHADKLRTGEKTIELRAGVRYRHVTEGRLLSINGYFKVRVKGIYQVPATEVEDFVSCFHKELGFSSVGDALNALGDCYAASTEPFFAFEVERVISEQEAPLFAAL